jgi:hypothetical protein
MQSTQDRTSEYAASRLDPAQDRRILVQGQVHAHLVDPVAVPAVALYAISDLLGISNGLQSRYQSAITTSFVCRHIPYTCMAPEPVLELLRHDLALRTFRISSLCESVPA